MRFRKTATAIIINDNKILLFRRDNIPTIAEPDRWQLPGGHLEDGETPVEALRRELVEEVSYSPKNIQFIGSLKNKVREVNVFWSYVDSKEAKKFKLGKTEGQAIKFMSIEEALNKNLTTNVKFYLTCYKKIISEHMENKTVPKIEDLRRSTSFIKLLQLKLLSSLKPKI